MLKLYDYFRSSAAFRVRIALNLKGLTYKSIPIHLVNHGGEHHSDAYSQLNPHQLVPCLDDSGQILTQSLAIIEYLNDTHPTPPLLPVAPYHKALVRAFALSIAADLHPLNNLRVLKYLTTEFKISDEQKTKWYQHWVNKCFTGLETQLRQHNLAGAFCFGDHPSLADICLVPQMYNARRFNCDLSAFPTLVRIDEHCQTISAFANAWPNEAIA